MRANCSGRNHELFLAISCRAGERWRSTGQAVATHERQVHCGIISYGVGIQTGEAVDSSRLVGLPGRVRGKWASALRSIGGPRRRQRCGRAPSGAGAATEVVSRAEASRGETGQQRMNELSCDVSSSEPTVGQDKALAVSWSGVVGQSTRRQGKSHLGRRFDKGGAGSCHPILCRPPVSSLTAHQASAADATRRQVHHRRRDDIACPVVALPPPSRLQCTASASFGILASQSLCSRAAAPEARLHS